MIIFGSWIKKEKVFYGFTLLSFVGKTLVLFSFSFGGFTFPLLSPVKGAFFGSIAEISLTSSLFPYPTFKKNCQKTKNISQS